MRARAWGLGVSCRSGEGLWDSWAVGTANRMATPSLPPGAGSPRAAQALRAPASLATEWGSTGGPESS